jgi:hypothetical protein
METFSRARILGSASAVALATPLALLAAGAAVPKGDAADDVATLNTELPLARAAVKAYGDAAATNVLSPPVLAVAKQFGTDHQAHADAFAAAIGQAGGTAASTSSPTQSDATADIASLKNELDILANSRAARARLWAS